MFPDALYLAAQTREIDRIAIAQHGFSGAELMHRAADAAFGYITSRYSGAHYLCVVCGPGNNGGDGYLLAARAREIGMRVRVLAAADAVSDDAIAAAREYRDGGGEICGDIGELDRADLIVDALFGTGLSRAPHGIAADFIARINAAHCPVIALDMPSGLSDRGFAFSPCVRARATITFIGLKFGLFSGHGRDHAGEIVLEDLRIPKVAMQSVPPAARIIPPPKLQPRKLDMHKGDAGRVLVVGGGRGMFGAALLTAEAALRCGAGLVTLASHDAHLDMAALHRPELMSSDALAVRAKNPPAEVVALGPGLGQDEWGRRVFDRFIDGGAKMIADADALNFLARNPRRRDDWTLTPHPGEAARLLQCSPAEVQADRLKAAREIAGKFGGVCVLKGAGTLVADADSVWLCDRGNPGMASGGMGDILAGVIAAFIAPGNSPPLPNILNAVWLHAHAADTAAAETGERGLLASDVIAQLPAAILRCERRMG